MNWHAGDALPAPEPIKVSERRSGLSVLQRGGRALGAWKRGLRAAEVVIRDSLREPETGLVAGTALVEFWRSVDV